MRGPLYLVLALTAVVPLEEVPHLARVPREVRPAVYIDSDAQRAGDGTAEHPYPGLEFLHSISAEETDTVFVTGEYPRQAMLDYHLHSGVQDRPFCLVAWPGREPPTVHGLVTDRTSHLVIDGFVFRGVRGRTGLGLFVNGSSDVTVRNCVMTDNDEAGACLKGSTNVVLERCDLSGNIGGGLIMPDVENALVTSSTMCGNGDCGIVVDSAYDFVVEGCIIESVCARQWKGIFVNNVLLGRVPLLRRVFDDWNDVSHARPPQRQR